MNIDIQNNMYKTFQSFDICINKTDKLATPSIFVLNKLDEIIVTMWKLSTAIS